MRTAANAPVATCWDTAIAAPVGEAEAWAAVAEAELEPEPPELEAELPELPEAAAPEDAAGDEVAEAELPAAAEV